MKNFLFIALIAVFCSTATAQEDSVENDSKLRIKFSLDLGSSINDNDASNFSKFNIGLNYTHLYCITDDVQIGATVGLRRVFKDYPDGYNTDLDTENGVFLYFGGELRLYTDNDKFYLGGDSGYTTGLYTDGFYYRPKIGFVISECSGIFASYTGINADSKFTTVNIGYEFSF